MDKAIVDAKKNIVSVPILNETIPHQVEAKYSAARILLKPQSKGRGLVAGGTVRVICSMAGIRNISSKVLGRTGNKINNAKATLNALKKLKVKVK
ncbi:MAG: 30S ribosomal protein S5, partial [Candidatus Nealsonbacteria bacterium]|nr:30S ribosomal protein S5 [Candidatus Nealsonbacteria bacterium]